MEDDLRGVVAVGLQEQGIHVRMAGNAGSLSLYGLGAANLQTLRGGVAVQRHVLCLEGRRLIAVLQEDATQGRSNDALANVAACACQHDGMKPFHILNKCV